MRLTRSIVVTVMTVLALASAASAQTITAQQDAEILTACRDLATAFIAQQAAAFKLDMQQFDASSSGTAFDSAISKDMTEGAGVSVNGTPTFFVGKTTAQGFAALK